MTVYVVPLVEGETERRCIKIILSRVWRELLQASDVAALAVLEPVEVDRSGCTKKDHPELGTKLEQAARDIRYHKKRPGVVGGFILLLLDADEACPATVSRELRDRANALCTDILTACVMPKRELENWFKAAAKSLAGFGGLPADLVTPDNPEAGSGDAWLTLQKKRVDLKSKYEKPGDARELAGRMDLKQCYDNSRSFRKLCKELAARVPSPPSSASPDEPPPTT